MQRPDIARHIARIQEFHAGGSLLMARGGDSCRFHSIVDAALNDPVDVGHGPDHGRQPAVVP
jgi:hypothetical protein